mmetsp:Transcript_16797/g.46108  ORF Transcript_16797/g.46108 Transcript_16797/m.46108 type:complete len:105 (+) Transcript_16797:83-397(+)
MNESSSIDWSIENRKLLFEPLADSSSNRSELSSISIHGQVTIKRRTSKHKNTTTQQQEYNTIQYNSILYQYGTHHQNQQSCFYLLFRTRQQDTSSLPWPYWHWA